MLFHKIQCSVKERYVFLVIFCPFLPRSKRINHFKTNDTVLLTNADKEASYVTKRVLSQPLNNAQKSVDEETFETNVLVKLQNRTGIILTQYYSNFSSAFICNRILLKR